MKKFKAYGAIIREKDLCGNSRWSDGCILPDSTWGKEFGFTSDRFDGWLWKMGHWIVVSQITSHEPGSGHFKHLIRRIKDFAFDVAVPTPLAQMEAVLRRWRWSPHLIGDPTFGTVELWTEPGKDPRYLEPDSVRLKRAAEIPG